MMDRRSPLEVLLDGADKIVSKIFIGLVDASDKSSGSLYRLQVLEESFQDLTGRLRKELILIECRRKGHDWDWSERCRRCGLEKAPDGCLLAFDDEVQR